jgi:hypothetical protein
MWWGLKSLTTTYTDGPGLNQGHKCGGVSSHWPQHTLMVLAWIRDKHVVGSQVIDHNIHWWSWLESGTQMWWGLKSLTTTYTDGPGLNQGHKCGGGLKSLTTTYPDGPGLNQGHKCGRVNLLIESQPSELVNEIPNDNTKINKQ